MFSDVVMELPKPEFEKIIDQKKEEKGVKQDTELDTEDMKDLVKRFKAFYKENKGEDFPSDPKVQLMEAVKAVFRSWDNPRANVYRRMNEIPYDLSLIHISYSCTSSPFSRRIASLSKRRYMS